LIKKSFILHDIKNISHYTVGLLTILIEWIDCCEADTSCC